MQPVDKKPHILVIEDNPSDVALLRYALAGAGLDCQLTIIDDGGDALALFRREEAPAGRPVPDLAIVDLNLPKHGGLEILEQMRANRTFAQVPLVVLSSSTSSHERAKIEKFGIRRQIVKPVELQEFLKIGWIIKELLLESGTGDSTGSS
jgi:DNA-binding response OmpR family regulator